MTPVTYDLYIKQMNYNVMMVCMYAQLCVEEGANCNMNN